MYRRRRGMYNRDLTKLRRRRQREPKKSNRFNDQQLCTCITLFCQFLCRPCTTTTWNGQTLSLLENGNDKAMNSTISDWTRARSPLFTSNLNSLLLSKRATWDNREVVSKDAKSIFQRRFYGRRRCRIRDLTKPRRRRQRERQETIGFMSKTTTLHVHHGFLYISLPSLRNYDVKWPNFKFTWERERQGDKFYHVCQNLSAYPSLQLQPKYLSFKTRRIGIIAKKFKLMRSLFFIDVFMDVAVVES